MEPDSPPADADERFRSALRRGATGEVLEAADEAQQAGDFGRSRQWLEEASALWPAHPQILSRLLELHHRYRRWDQFDEVAAKAQRVAEPSAALYFAIGCGQETRGAWEPACTAFRRALDLEGGDVEILLRLARCLRAAGRGKEAVTALRAGLRLHDDAAPLHAALGYALVEAEQVEGAVACFERAIEHAPDWHPYLNDLAGALMLCERWQEAARVSAWYLKLHKKSERAWTVYGIAHARLGDQRRAEQGYRNAIRAARDPSRAKGNLGLFLAGRPAQLLEAVRLLQEAHAAHPDWVEVGRKLDGLLDEKA